MISINRNLEIPFINDENVIGSWRVIDYINDKNKFDPDYKFSNSDLFLKSYEFLSNGKLVAVFDGERKNLMSWSKGCVLNEIIKIVCKYEIKHIFNNDYMFVEWKSGDCAFGDKVYGYYVLKKLVK